MKPCNRIYYSTVHWRLSMFPAAYRSSSGALTVFAASGLRKHVVTGRSQVWVGLDYGLSPHAYVNQRLQIQLELLMMSGMPLETCWAVNERWNNKFYYKVASCWLFILSHTTMHGSMNIKSYLRIRMLNFLFSIPCIVVQLYHVNQQNAHFLNSFFKFNSSCLLHVSNRDPPTC